MLRRRALSSMLAQCRCDGVRLDACSLGQLALCHLQLTTVDEQLRASLIQRRQRLRALVDLSLHSGQTVDHFVSRGSHGDARYEKLSALGSIPVKQQNDHERQLRRMGLRGRAKIAITNHCRLASETMHPRFAGFGAGGAYSTILTVNSGYE